MHLGKQSTNFQLSNWPSVGRTFLGLAALGPVSVVKILASCPMMQKLTPVSRVPNQTSQNVLTSCAPKGSIEPLSKALKHHMHLREVLDH